ncbi:MAG: hypothetical protein KF752_14980 [Pirellulaceae bacterium]|nr:hypothetical protein [Pirellulaceae bacterium]
MMTKLLQCMAVSSLIVVTFSPVVTSGEAAGCKQPSTELCQHSPPELWIVSSRCAPRCDGLDEGFEKLTYQRFDECTRRFVQQNRESFLAAQANIPTMLFSHGNSLDHPAAMEVCWKVYDRLKVCSGPKLMVFWSWPAEILYRRPVIRPIELARTNIKAKYIYAERQGYYIAKLTNLMSTVQPITLSGHSYGGVTVICALHFLGGGQLDGIGLPPEQAQPVERVNLRAGIISGALDCDAMYPGHRYERALVAVEKLYTTYNDRDSTLKRWPTHSFRDQQALGYTGMCLACLGEHACKVRQDHLTVDVKRSHYIQPHLNSLTMMDAICEMAFGEGVCLCPAQCGRRGAASRVQAADMRRILELPATTVFPGLAL